MYFLTQMRNRCTCISRKTRCAIYLLLSSDSITVRTGFLHDCREICMYADKVTFASSWYTSQINESEIQPDTYPTAFCSLSLDEYTNHLLIYAVKTTWLHVLESTHLASHYGCWGLVNCKTVSRVSGFYNSKIKVLLTQKLTKRTCRVLSEIF